MNYLTFSLKLLLCIPAVCWFEDTFPMEILIWLPRLNICIKLREQKVFTLRQGQISVCNLKKPIKIFEGESDTFLFVWNPNIPVGKRCGWLSSSQRTSFVRDSSITFPTSDIEMIFFSQGVFTKTVSFALHLYLSRGFLRHSVFELLSKLSEWLQILSFIQNSVGSKMSVVTLKVTSAL